MDILQSILNFLFDSNGLQIVRWYLILIFIDIITGTVQSALTSGLKSRQYLKGITLKLLGISLIIVANSMDDIFQSYMHISLGIDLSDSYALALIGYELLSIIENMNQLGVFTGKLKTFADKVFNQTNNKE